MKCPNCNGNITRANLDTRSTVILDQFGSGHLATHAPQTATISCPHCTYELDTHLAKIRAIWQQMQDEKAPETHTPGLFGHQGRCRKCGEHVEAVGTRGNCGWCASSL